MTRGTVRKYQKVQIDANSDTSDNVGGPRGRQLRRRDASGRTARPAPAPKRTAKRAPKRRARAPQRPAKVVQTRPGKATSSSTSTSGKRKENAGEFSLESGPGE